MKKLLAVFLALMMILSVSLVACSDKKEKDPNDEEIEEDNEFVPNSGNETTGTTDENDNDNDPATTKAPSSSEWVNESGTIYVRANGVNIRASNRTNSTIIDSANFGDALQYEAFNDAWYKIKYNGTTAYISSAFVIGNQNTVIFEEHATLKTGTAIKIAADKTCNLRTDPAVAGSTLKGSIDATKTANGELTIVKINKTGTWAEVRFKGTDIEKHTYTGDEVLYCTTEVIAELIGSSTSNPHG